MLSIAKLAAGQEGYYLSAVADGVEEYYTAAGESAGRWIGASGVLGLSGEVRPEDLHVVLAGRHPVTAEALGRANRRLPSKWAMQEAFGILGCRPRRCVRTW